MAWRTWESNFIDNGEPLKVSEQASDVVRGSFLEDKFSSKVLGGLERGEAEAR